MVDRVRPLKMEHPDTGGTQTDYDLTEANPNEDGPDVRSVFLQNDTSDDANVEVSRDSSDNLTFKDGENTTPLTLTQVMAALPPATLVGQVLVSKDGLTFEQVRPLVSGRGGMITNRNGYMVVHG